MYGVVDIGSNTIRLVVYKVDNNDIKAMINKKFSVGLAGYIDSNGALNNEGIEKTIEALTEFRKTICYMEIKEIFCFATASLRNINNSEEVLKAIKAKTDFDVKIISGDEEALFDYYGVLQSIDVESGLVVDIGGGSTELVFFENRQVIATKSLPIGSLNLYKSFVAGLVPIKKELKAIRHRTKTLLEEIEIDEGFCCEKICGVGGTARAVNKILEDIRQLKGDEYPTDMLTDLVELAKEDATVFTESLLKTAPERIHTFVPGLVVLNTIARFYSSQTIITSPYGVREGYLYHILSQRGVIKGAV